MRKTIEELKKMNTKRLLKYYKAERKRFYAAGYWCDCGCGEMIWDVNTSYIDMEQKYDEHFEYLTLIKSELNSREHVSKE